MDIDSPMIGAYLAGEATEDERAAVDRWRAASPENERQLQSRARIWELVGRMAPELDRQVNPEVEWVEAKGVVSARHPPGPVRQSGGRRRAIPGRWLGLATAAVLLLAFGFLLEDRVRSGGLGVEDIVTGSGEIVTVALRDGTVVRLGPESRLGFDPRGGRDVHLEGQAYFAVRHEGRVPFRVFTEGGEVTVLGTRFDVRARGAAVRVVVVEGAVEMQAQGERVSVGASEMGTSAAGGEPEVHRVEDVYEATAWVGEFIAFGATPLSAVALELEQRFGLQVEIADEDLASRTVTGWFRDQSPVEALASICFVVNAQCVQVEGGFRIEHGVLPGAGAVEVVPP